MKGTLRHTLSQIEGDLPGGRFTVRRFLFNYFFRARFRVLLNYRIGSFCQGSGNSFLKLIALRYKYKLLTKRGCDVSYDSTIGKRLKLPHPIGIVIGDGVIIKDDVTIFQQVTLGSHGKSGEGLAYPTIGNNVKIYAGAKIIGGVTIGENSVIGASTLVNKDVPPNSVAYGIPCKIKHASVQ